MEKLLDLLQEFYGENRKFSNENGLLTMTNGVENLSGAYAQTYIISKQGGFIKWLVENDKIDRDKCGFKNEGLSGNWYDSGIAFVQNYDNDTYKVSEFYSPYLQLLMLLSISDTPIEDLISYLK